MPPEAMEILPNRALAAAREAREAKLAKFEAERVARAVLVPTSDATVRENLRARAMPVCLFGEDGHDRRERLRGALAHEKLTGQERVPTGGGEVVAEVEELRREEYLTEGGAELRKVRAELVEMSVRKAGERLARERGGVGRRAAREREERAVRCVRRMEVVASQVGGERPLSAICLFEAGGQRRVVTGGWGGGVRVWEGEGRCEEVQRLALHEGRVSAVCVPREWSDVLLTAAADGCAAVSARGEEGKFAERARLKGHRGRVGDVKMHPGRKGLVVSGGFDGEVRVWDDGREVMRQESGHEAVYRVGFHPDGGLMGSGGLEGGIRMWDLRSGRAVMTMGKAHAGGVLGLEFCADGQRVVTGGGDNVVRVWDLRAGKCEKTVAAHRGLVSAVRCGGDVVFSGSFDRSVKCWGVKRGWSLIAAVTGFEEKVTGVDCSAGGEVLVAACYDKTWKMWSGVED